MVSSRKLVEKIERRNKQKDLIKKREDIIDEDGIINNIKAKFKRHCEEGFDLSKEQSECITSNGVKEKKFEEK